MPNTQAARLRPVGLRRLRLRALARPDRRRPDLQPGAERGRDPGRHERRRPVQPGTGGERFGDLADLGARAACGRVLQLRVLRSRGPAPHLLVELRRRGHLELREPLAHLHRHRHLSGTADRLRRRQLLDLHADHDQRRQRPDRDDLLPERRRAVSGRGRDLLQRGWHRPRRRFAARQRLHLEHRFPARRPRPSRHPDHRHAQRQLHDPDLRTRFQRQHALSHHPDGPRLRRPDLDEVGDRQPAEGQPHLRHGAQRPDALPRRDRQDGAVFYDTLVGFNHTIEARDQTSGNTAYTFASWSDGGARQHTITVPASPATYTASFNSTPLASGLVGAWASTRAAARPARLLGERSITAPWSGRRPGTPPANTARRCRSAAWAATSPSRTPPRST